jgi:hypothetical protein
MSQSGAEVGGVTARGRQHGGRQDRSGRGRSPSWRRVVAVVVVMTLALATLVVVGTTSLSPLHSSGSAGAAAVCQSDGASGCQASLPCSTGTCPTVDVEPANGLSDDEYVFVKVTDFPSGDSMRIALCSLTTSSTDPSCLEGQWESNQWGPVQVPISENAQGNSTQTAVPVFFDQSGDGNSAMPAHDITNARGAVAGIFCDNTSDPCAIEVTEEQGTGNEVGNGPSVSASNTVSVPLNYAAQNGGCPAADTELQTDSSFSLEHFIPAAVDATCAGPKGVVALNTATDNNTVAEDFASGSIQMGFIDDPADPTQVALVAGKGYAYIPVAVSGTAVSMLAAESDDTGTAFPDSNYNLTPNMVAGLVSGEYQKAQGSVQAFTPYNFALSDNIVAALGNASPPVTCADLLGCPLATKKKQVYNQNLWETGDNAFFLLNPVSSGNNPPDTFGSFDSDVANGSSYQVTNWLCNSPNHSYSVGVDENNPPAGTNPVAVTVTDTNTAPSTFTTPPVGSSIWPPPTDPTSPWVFPTCQPYANFPSLAASTNGYGESQSPALQAKSMRSFAYGGNSAPSIPFPSTGTDDPPAAFGVMDSSEAAFYGLNTASVQNAGGTFVAPTRASLEAAEQNLASCPADDTGCPTGTYSVEYASSASTGAYPMPDVTYALVSTNPQPAAQAEAEANLLTNLVTFSHNGGGGSLNLPDGYAPLSGALYQAALADIGNDIVAEPANSTTPTGSSGGGKGSAGGGSSGGSGSSSPSSGSTVTSSSPFTGSAGSAGSAASAGSNGTSGKGGNGSGLGGVGGASSSSTGFLLVALDTAARYLLPATVLVALVCLIAGPLLLFYPDLFRRRRRRRAGGPS